MNNIIEFSYREFSDEESIGGACRQTCAASIIISLSGEVFK